MIFGRFGEFTNFFGEFLEMKTIFPELLEGGRGMQKVWTGSRVALVFLGIFWEFFGGRKEENFRVH